MDWNETDSNWGGPLWNSSTPDSAIFGPNGAGTVNLTTNITANTVSVNAPGYFFAGNALTLGGIGPLITNTADVAISCVLGGTAGFSKSGAGKLTLAGANTFTGNVILNSGTLQLVHSSGLGLGSKTFYMQGGSRTLQLSGGITLSNNIAMTLSSNSGDGSGVANVDGDNEIQGNIGYSTGNPALNISSLAGSLKISGNVTLVTSTRTLLLGGSSTNDNVISGVIGQTGGVLPVTKQGVGTWRFTANNTYSGDTLIKSGKLVWQAGGSCSNSAVTVSATAGTTAVLALAVTDNTRRWTCSSLTFSNAGIASDLEFRFDGTAPSLSLAPLRVTGALSFTNTPAVTVFVGSTVGAPGTLYPLLTWGSLSGTAPTAVSVIAPRPVTGHLTVSGNTLYLVIDSNANGTIKWAASGSGVWDTATTNWATSGGQPTTYNEPITPGDAVVFDETYLSANTTVTLDSLVNPASVTVSNATRNYTLVGNGGIRGATGLVKQGAGRLTLNTTNTFAGNVTINGGTLAVTGNGRLYYGTANPAAVVTVNAGATLELEKWWMHNDDSLGLLGNSASNLVVNGGTIRVNGITGYGRGVTVNGSATFETAPAGDWFIHDYNGTMPFVYNSKPTLIFTGAGVGHFWKAITGGCTVAKRGTGRWSLLGEGSSYTGNTIVEQGVLRIMRATLSDTATVIIQRGGVLDLWHDDTDKVGALIINGVTMPPGTYNRTTHPEYFLGRGSLIVGGAASTGPTALTYYTSGEEGWPAGKETAITNSMNGCLSYYNAYGTYGRLGGNIRIQYSSSVPTANAAQGGPITFGGSISTRTAVHEMAHVFGTGTAWQWDYHRSGGQWLGPHANNLVYQIDHSRSIGCDPAHFWPYNINYPNEDSTKARQVSPMVVAAMRRDMGMFNDPPTISPVADQVVSTNMSTGPIPFTIGDPDTAVSSLNVTVHSSNTNLVPANNIFLSGAGTNRTVTVTPTGNQGGSAVITLFVMDSEWATPTSFAVSIGLGAPTAYHWLVGNGTWDTVTPNWWGLGTLWPNSGNDQAIIGGPSGTINLVPGITANSVTFNSSATIRSNTLTLSGTLAKLSAQGGATGVVATVVSGSAGLTKQGAGAVILSRTNTYTGVTTIQDGLLQLGDGVGDGALAGSTSIVVSNNGVFGANLQSSRALSQIVSGNGGLLKSGSATLTLPNANTYTGPTTVSAGTLVVSNNHASSAHTIAAGAVLELSTATGEKNYGSTAFAGSGTLRKSGANRAYWGATAATFALGSGALIDVQGGTLTGGSNGNENWDANQSDLNVAAGAIFDGVEANVRVDAITGTGTIKTGYGGAGYSDFTIGVANGSSTFDGVIANSSSTGNLTKEGSGTITLTKANTYTGTTAVGAGKLRITHSGGLGGSGGVTVQGGDSSATLELAGTNLVIAGKILTLTGKQGNNVDTAHLRNVSGTNTWTGAMQTETGGNRYNLESQSGHLIISGPLNNSLSGRYWQLLGSGDGVVSGVIGGGSSPSTTYLNKSGSGTWTLSATNIYTGATTINAGTLRVTGILANTAVTNDGGTLAGNGVINGPVAIVSGTLEPGASAALNETLTIQNDLSLGDTTRFQIGKSGATPVCDRVVGVVNMNYDGTLIVTNVTGATWVNGDAFNLFSASGTKAGNFTNIVLQPAVAGVTPSFDPATGNLTLVVTAPPTLQVRPLGGGILQFSWTGSYKLQSQTNTLSTGLGTNWFDYPGGGTSPVSVPVNPAQGSVFFRLVSP